MWIVVWHGIYAGTFATCAEAETRLQSIDRLTLLEWHSLQQTEKGMWQRRFRSLYSDLKAWHDYFFAED